MRTLPLVTIAILSWNRLHYLRATLESARRCIQYPNLEWIVSDNDSDEPGLHKYLSSLSWVDHLLQKKQTHADAMNEIVERASGEYLILWPDDAQFIVEGDWLQDIIEIMQNNEDLGSVTLDALRLLTLQRILAPLSWRDIPQITREIYWYRNNYRRPRAIYSSRGFRMEACGWRHSGVCPSGIPSLTLTKTWRRIGQWAVSAGGCNNIIDSSLGSEDNMLNKFFLSRLPLLAGLPWIPVAADIITDPLGCKAKVRGNRRFGVYMPAQSSDGLYYRIRSQMEICQNPERPLSFMELVQPLGFKIPVDDEGERLKYSINTSVVYDMKRQCYISYPLIDSIEREISW